MNIVVIGAGALGSHLVLLGRSWDATLTVVDFDRVERKNTLSQFHSRQGVGRNKAQALAQAMQGLFGLRLSAVPHRLSEDNAEAVLGGAALIVDCTDHAPTRRLIAAQAQAMGVPCLHGALAADGAYARVMWSERFTADEGGEGEATCEDGEHLPFIAYVSARMAMIVQRYLREGERRDEHLHPGGVTAL
ncbi:MAG: ThiF family adenylyltransferase [Alphaproteobacteria bacterium]|nr:ThiF family adenylyltransferase [Alphaproteobacteria bacterium]MCB9792719.1 ThiF family adenylyltransferase [Alphaproteobacteria bacterium]